MRYPLGMGGYHPNAMGQEPEPAFEPAPRPRGWSEMTPLGKFALVTLGGLALWALLKPERPPAVEYVYVEAEDDEDNDD